MATPPLQIEAYKEAVRRVEDQLRRGGRPQGVGGGEGLADEIVTAIAAFVALIGRFDAKTKLTLT